MLILAGSHVYCVSCKIAIGKKSCLKWWSLLALIALIPYQAGMTIVLLLTSDKYCQFIMFMTGSACAIGKITLYLLFIERLFYVFQGTDLEYKKSQKIIGRIVFVLLSFLKILVLGIFLAPQASNDFDPTPGVCITPGTYWISICYIK